MVNVKHTTFTVDVETKHSARYIEDVQWMVPYHHYSNGEGVHFIPEVGAKCLVAWPNDNTPPFVMGFIGAAGTLESEDGTPIRSTPDGGSTTDVTFRSRRPKMLPGDIGFTGRDENFVMLRRGGVLELGATSIAQRLYIPIRNYVKDFCENYSMEAFGGDVAWTVERAEADPSGQAPASYTFHMNEFAQDEKATVRVRYTPLLEPGGSSKTAWEVQVAPQNIDRDTGAVSSAVYSMLVTLSGEKTEFIGGGRSVEIQGEDSLKVSGSRRVEVGGSEDHQVTGNLILKAGPTAVLEALAVHVGGRGGEPGIKGTSLLTAMASLQLPVITTAAGQFAGPPTPASMALLQRALSGKVYIV